MSILPGLNMTGMGTRAAGIDISAVPGLWAYYDPAVSTSMYQARTGTGAHPGDGDPVGYLSDIGGNGRDWIAPSDTARPTLRQSGGLWHLEFDGVNDTLEGNAATFGFRRNVAESTVVLSEDRSTESIYSTLHFQFGANNNAALDLKTNSATTARVSGRRVYADSFDSLAVTVTATRNIPAVLVGINDWANGDAEVRFNGLSATETGTYSSTGNTDDQDMNVAEMGQQSGNFSATKIYCVALIESALAGDDLDLIERWAASKIGVDKTW